MAKGQYLSSYQKGIVRRFYNNRDTILVTRLQEAASEVYLAEGAKAEKLWKKIEQTLSKLETDPPVPESRLRQIIDGRDAALLAGLVNELAGKN